MCVLASLSATVRRRSHQSGAGYRHHRPPDHGAGDGYFLRLPGHGRLHPLSRSGVVGQRRRHGHHHTGLPRQPPRLRRCQRCQGDPLGHWCHRVDRLDRSCLPRPHPLEGLQRQRRRGRDPDRAQPGERLRCQDQGIQLLRQLRHLDGPARQRRPVGSGCLVGFPRPRRPGADRPDLEGALCGRATVRCRATSWATEPPS